MGEERLARDFPRDIVLFGADGINPVVVHGGGPRSSMLKKVGLQSQYAAGLRITDARRSNRRDGARRSINSRWSATSTKPAQGLGLCGKDGTWWIGAS